MRFPRPRGIQPWCEGMRMRGVTLSARSCKIIKQVTCAANIAVAILTYNALVVVNEFAPPPPILGAFWGRFWRTLQNP